MNDTVLLSREGAIATLTLNRPSAVNALDAPMVDALVARTAEIAADDAIRVVILKGAGRHFMAGGDIRVFAHSLADDASKRRTSFQRFAECVHAGVETLARMPQPVIARLQGAVAGFGLSLANGCDLAYASDDTYFASAYLTLGVSPDGGGTYWLPRIVGSRRAAEILMLGDRFDAKHAHAIGLVNRVVVADDLDRVVDEAAQRLAAAPTRALRNLKRLLRESTRSSLSEQLSAEATSFGECAGSVDFVEGVQAFLAKRAPDFHRG
ncbi:MAG TPA: enoyl-CoA hydratase [Casimicrobiaceae bacterium]|nr:enoyl-CoA hydratase [Casimicrobiaceae bacterium]